MLRVSPRSAVNEYPKGLACVLQEVSHQGYIVPRKGRDRLDYDAGHERSDGAR